MKTSYLKVNKPKLFPNGESGNETSRPMEGSLTKASPTSLDLRITCERRVDCSTNFITHSTLILREQLRHIQCMERAGNIHIFMFGIINFF